MDSPSNQEGGQSVAERRRPKILFALATLTLLSSLLAMAFGERAYVTLAFSLLMYWQSWAIATEGSELRQRIATRWIPFGVSGAGGVAMVVVGIMRLAAGRTAAAVVAFAGAIFVAALITWLLWLNRRASSRGVGG